METIAVVLLFTIYKSTVAEPPIVYTRNGAVEGASSITVDNSTPYYYFWGIPYAEPPVEDLRFEPPRPAKPWEGILDGKNERNICVQSLGEVIGSEDCLYLDVYTPELPNAASANLKPVLVWIYGGFFTNGHKDYTLFGPDYFLNNRSLVYVALNFRNGVFGFLSTQDAVVPGNNGLKDIILGLQWINDNIASFGGDPSRVTIFGQSTGSALVQYLIQAPTANGLFQQAISASGSSLNTWAFSSSALNNINNLQLLLNITGDNSQEIVHQLKLTDYRDLQNAAYNLSLDGITGVMNGFVWAPVIEPDLTGAVLSTGSYEILSKGQFNRVSVLLGYTSNELIAEASYMADYTSILSYLNFFPSLLVPSNMNVEDPALEEAAGTEIRNFYFGDQARPSDLEKFVKYSSDSFFAKGINRAAKFYSQYNKTYLYKFSYGSENVTFDENVGHSTDLPYYWYSPNYTYPEDQANDLTRDRMTGFIKNFVTAGNPTPYQDEIIDVVWPALDPNSEDVDYLNIGGELEVSKNPDGDAIAFWEKLYENYGIPPFSTY